MAESRQEGYRGQSEFEFVDEGIHSEVWPLELVNE